MRSTFAVACSLGVIVIVSTHLAVGWWLNSGTGIVAVLTCLFAVAILLSIRTHALPVVMADMAGFWIGCVSGATAILAWIGPGTIWPIVLIVGASLMAMAIALGARVNCST